MKTIILCLFFLCSVTFVVAQENNTPALLRHEMSPEELLRKHEIGKNFIETDPPAGPVRNIAEFDRMQGALIRYPFGIPMTLIKEMAEDVIVTTIVASQSQKNTVISQYIANGVDTSHCNFLIAPTDSYWTRDYGPWFESDSANNVGIVDFPYNRPRPKDDEIPKLLATMMGISCYGMNISHTGGNYMTDGYGVGSSTDLVWDENPGQTPDQIDEKMSSYLGISNYQVVPDPNTSSTIDHIDCWAKFLSPDKILIRKVLLADPEFNALESAAAYWASQTCSYGYNYKVFRVMTPQDQPYSNSVIMNNKVLVPFMNSNWDDSAKAVYEAAMPGYEVIGFAGNPSTPWMSTDALHCRVMGLADLGILFIKHIPISGVQPCESDYIITADIIACSDSSVNNDSVLIWYNVNNGEYKPIQMVNTSANHYTGVIPRQPHGSTIKYYLFAADNSNRRERAPFIGEADPFVFSTAYSNIAAIPDTLWFLTYDDALNGKSTYIHNFLSETVSLTSIEQFNTSEPFWLVDSMSVATFPHSMLPGDSVFVHVVIGLVTSMSPSMQFIVDTLHYTTNLGTGKVIIMVNDELLTGTGDGLEYEISQSNYPNPFSLETTIPVKLFRSEKIDLSVFNLHGKLLRNIYSGTGTAGMQLFTWDGTDANGNKMQAGVYIYLLKTGSQTIARKMMLIR